LDATGTAGENAHHMPDDPILRFRRWFAGARRAGTPLPEAVALATASTAGRPVVRYVLLKEVDARGFVFFTDGRSRKGSELGRNPRAAFAVYWHASGHQVRVEGRVAPVSRAEVDAYWRTRPRPSQLAAWSSHQSAPLPSRAALLARWRRLARIHRGREIPRPPAWTGFRLVPDAIEFWIRRAHRLHERERFERGRRGWRRRALQP
jgi:pyridoxamine 5'-phosphate oxidase